MHKVPREGLDAPGPLPRRASPPVADAAREFQPRELAREALEALDGQLVYAPRGPELPGQTFVFERGKPQRLQDEVARIDEPALCAPGGGEFRVEDGEPVCKRGGQRAQVAGQSAAEGQGHSACILGHVGRARAPPQDRRRGGQLGADLRGQVREEFEKVRVGGVAP